MNAFIHRSKATTHINMKKAYKFKKKKSIQIINSNRIFCITASSTSAYEVFRTISPHDVDLI